MSNLLSTETKSVWHLLTDSFKIYRATLTQFFPLIGVFLLIQSVLICGGIIFCGGVTKAQLLYLSSFTSGAHTWPWFISVAIFIMLTLWFYSAAILKANSILFNLSQPFKTILIRSFLRGIIVMLLWGLFILILLVVGILLFLIEVLIFGHNFHDHIIARLILFLIEIYFIIRLFGLSNFILIGQSTFKALRNSFSFSKKNCWRILGYMMSIYIINFLVILIAVLFIVACDYVFERFIFHSDNSIGSIFFQTFSVCVLAISYVIAYGLIIWDVIIKWVFINNLQLRHNHIQK